MKLTEQEAIDKTIEMWTWLAETGKDKEDWPQWEQNGGVYDRIQDNCFLCEFDHQHNGYCEHCPYLEAYGVDCYEDREPFYGWQNARTTRTSKKYAALFLAKIIALREEK